MHDLSTLLSSMEPVLNEGVYAYVVVPSDADTSTLKPVATFREAEGLTVIVTEQAALAAGLQIQFRAAWITLKVQSALDAIGFTAAFSSALSRAGISCNVIAGAYHDHLFVPCDRAQDALSVLRDLQRGAIRS